MRARGWSSLIGPVATAAALLLASGMPAGCGKRGKREEAAPPAADAPATPAGGAPASPNPTPPMRSESFRITDYSATIAPAPAAADAGAPAAPAGGK